MSEEINFDASIFGNRLYSQSVRNYAEFEKYITSGGYQPTPSANVVLSLIVDFYIFNNTPTSTYSRYFEGDRYVIISHSWIYMHFVLFGFNSVRTISRAVKELEDNDLVSVQRVPYVKGFLNAYKPSAQAIKLFTTGNDNLSAKAVDLSDYKPSDNLISFLTQMEAHCGTLYHYNVYKSNKQPNRYIMRTEAYIEQLLNGTFVTDNNLDGVELKELALSDIVDIASKVTVPAKTSLDGIFKTWKNKKSNQSPFLSAYRMLYPDAYVTSDENIQWAIDNEPHVMDRVKNKVGGDIKIDDKAMLTMLFTFVNYYHNAAHIVGLEMTNKRFNKLFDKRHVPALFPIYLQTYKDYDATYSAHPTWNRRYVNFQQWLANTRLDDSKLYTPCWWYNKTLYQTKGFFGTENPQVIESILKSIDTENDRRSGRESY